MRTFVVVLLTLIGSDKGLGIKCRDHDGSPLDWFVGYKLPLEEHDNGNSLMKRGEAYTYITSKDTDTWKLSEISINSTSSLLGMTLEPLFENEDLLFLLYNDESPNKTGDFKKGHTKGTILGDSSGGIWIIHSIPRFPSLDAQEYFYPHNAYEYGQSFLCISLDRENLANVGVQLKYNEPSVYSSNMPTKLIALYPDLNDVINGKTIKSPPWYHKTSLKSLNGDSFVSFAKSGLFHKDLYDDWIASDLKTTLLVETWPNEPGRLPSDCSRPYKVYNVQHISMQEMSFKSTVDHSKWAVSKQNTSDQSWICIGDINRAEPQKRRGGGAVCFSIQLVVEAYQNIVGTVQNCG